MTALVIRGDARQLPLPDESVDLIVTSPPYFALRSYTDGGEHYDGQIGSEATPAEFLEALWACTAEWVRVLKPSGSIFVNLGDKYASAARGPDGSSSGLTNGAQHRTGRTPRFGVPQKSLLGLPWRYAIGCIDQLGLILRAEIVWSKPNGLPESVTDRVRRSHETWFHFTREPRYYTAVDEIREPSDPRNVAYFSTQGQNATGYATDKRIAAGRNPNDPANTGRGIGCNPLGKLPGSVWEIPSEPLRTPEHIIVNPDRPGPGGVEWVRDDVEAWHAITRRPHLAACAWPRDDSRQEMRKAPDHFAAFPSEWPRRLILGWSPPGVCTACGEGRQPERSSEKVTSRPGINVRDQRMPGRHAAGNQGREGRAGDFIVTIDGYACACPDTSAPTTPAVVLDPFGGTGTTALVASVLGRIGITVDKSADYCRLAAWRTTDPEARARAMRVDKPARQAHGQETLFP